MRLIDADKLKEFYLELVNDEEVNDVRKLECLEAMRQIDEQPTAYDVDKVVEEINEESWEYMSDFQDSRVIDFIDTIDIVRRGGVNGRIIRRAL